MDYRYLDDGVVEIVVDVDGDYCPENCRWADNETQQYNRRDTVKITKNARAFSPCLKAGASARALLILEQLNM